MKKIKKEFGHTGDVQIVETTLPQNAKLISKKPVAFGEKSGHLHVITGDYEMFEYEQTKDVYGKVVVNGAFSQHVHETVWKDANYDTIEELQKADHKHGRLLPNKVYHVGIHKAYNPYKKIFEKVID